MQLNGFEIDIYNKYKLEEGKKYSTCPLCSENRKPQNRKAKVLMLDWNTGIGTCQHCSEILQLHTYKKKKTEKEYKRPNWANNTTLSDKLVKWFEGRGISQFTLRRSKITEGIEYMPQHNKKVNTVQFNYFRDDELINIKYRSGAKKFKLFKDAEKIFYNLDNIRTAKECVIVEGEMDVLSFVEVGIWNVVSVPNGASSTGLDYLDNCYDHFGNKEKIYLAVDQDEAGQGLKKELIRRLGAERCYIVDFDTEKDANDYLGKFGKEKLSKVLENAKQCPLENVITYKDIKEKLHNFYLNGMAPGYQIGLEQFDSMFSTYLSQFIVVTGIPTHGKSDFVDQMCVGYNLKYNWKIAYASPENKPTELHVDKISRKFYGQRPENKVQLNSDGWKIVEERVLDNFFFMEFDTYNLKSVLDKGAELVKRKGIKCLVIDPFNKITLKESDRNKTNQYTSDYINEIDDFCRKYDVLVILVAHPVKMKKDESGKMIEPTFYDIKGGGEFYDMSYHGLLVHRDFNKNTVKVKVLKCKFQNLGQNNAETHFCWSGLTGRYTEIKGDIELIEEVNPVWDNSNWLINEPEQIKNEFEENNNIVDWNDKQSFEPESAPF